MANGPIALLDEPVVCGSRCTGVTNKFQHRLLVKLINLQTMTTWSLHSNFLVCLSAHSNLNLNLNCYLVDNGYPHDGRADKNPYPHDRRADKDSYPHDSNNQCIIPRLQLPFAMINVQLMLV